MQEKNLLRYAFIGCITGILLLFFLSEFQREETANSFQMNEDGTSSGRIHFFARVMQVAKGNGIITLTVKNEQEVKVLLFKPDFFFVQKGSLVEITGTKQTNQMMRSNKIVSSNEMVSSDKINQSDKIKQSNKIKQLNQISKSNQIKQTNVLSSSEDIIADEVRIIE